MRKINKGKEPNGLKEYRAIPGANYKDMSTTCKDELRDSLLKDQGYICAYCMRHIPANDKDSNTATKIEHIQCQTYHPDRDLDYTNMVICCPGVIDGAAAKRQHCDTKKGESDITFDLFSDAFISTLSYGSKSGEITSSNTAYNKEINETLNLNYSLLKVNRARVIKAIQQSGIPKDNKGRWLKSDIIKLIKRWNNIGSDGKYKEYCGIAVWYLNKQLKRVGK